jgi:uncharacterized protein YdaU (DUF1376 family)
MHYYQFNIGDYQSHTAHLDPMEDLAYRRMLDWCYLHEKPLPLDASEIARLIRLRDDAAVVRDVLNEFFSQLDEGWVCDRVLDEIQHYKAKIDQASRAGKASAERRSNARSTDVQPTNNQEPITNNQIKEAKASLSGTTFPTCPHQEILKLWLAKLSHLPQPRVWEGSRQANLRQRWVQASKPSPFSKNGYKTVPDGLKWWESFFAYIAEDTTLAKGFETKGRVWVPDLEWVVNATNFQKIIDGKYNK